LNGTSADTHFDVGASLVLTVTPPFPVSRVRDGARSLCLLGYALDPVNPERDDEQVLRALLAETRDANDVVRACSDLGGRWAALYEDPDRTLLFHDAGGLRQVFFGEAGGALWCGSRSHSLARRLELEPSQSAAGFIASTEFDSMDGGRWWPGYGTSFAELDRLLPNHALDLRSGESFRYWPEERLPEISFEAAVRKIAADLRGTLSATAARFDPTFLVTAGRDSRSILACSRSVCRDLTYVSIGEPDDKDVTVPRRLLAKAGLENHRVSLDGLPTDEFWRRYLVDAPFAERSYAATAEAVAPYLGKDRVAIVGSVAEVARSYYASRLEPGTPVDAAALAGVTHMGLHPFASAEFEKWLDSVPAFRDSGVDPLDLFYWEQRVGSWLANWIGDYDLIWWDCVVPYNSRSLLAAALGIPAEHRVRGFEWQRRVIEIEWPELLEVPFNEEARSPLREFASKVRRRLRRRN
jgi:hypothetical protein